jgi:hypothetical protein
MGMRGAVPSQAGVAKCPASSNDNKGPSALLSLHGLDLLLISYEN